MVFPFSKTSKTFKDETTNVCKKKKIENIIKLKSWLSVIGQG